MLGSGKKQEAKMKRRLVTLIMMSALTMALVACGKESGNANVDAGNSSINVESDSTKNETENATVESTTDSETQNVEEEKAPATITTVKEADAVVDFDGIKLPMTITWEEFKQFMADNNWTFEDDEDDFPTDSNLLGNGFVNTNCGKVHFKFNKNEDGTKSVLMSVTVYKTYSPATVSIAGINIETTTDELSKVLATVEDRDDKFYLDDYLTVTIADESFSVNRTYFHMR